MRHFTMLCQFLFLCIASSFLTCGKGMKFSDNGYELLVAVHQSVSEDRNIITQIQEMMTSASEYLYTASRKHLYIREVTILVPESWMRDPSWDVNSEITFKQADVRVDRPNLAMDNTPYTFQPGQCGDPGWYIHLTPQFLLDDISRTVNYGDAGRVLVHELAHLRFGVFDEYGIPGSKLYPVYYVDDSSTDMKGTACSKDIKGEFVDVVKELPCSSGDSGTITNDNCAFLANAYGNKAVASVMYAQFLPEVTEFCETSPEPGNEKLQHNADAPNQHNAMCGKRGSWDVIKEHPDVVHSTRDLISDRTPVYKIVSIQSQTVEGITVCGRRFVFVLDLSGSMTGNSRYFKLRQTADQIIRDVLPAGSEVGIVVFSSSARVWNNMTLMKSPADREALAKTLPERGHFRGATAIGQGLLKAIELLKSGGKSTKDARLLLITDGGENRSPFVRSVIGGIIGDGVVVHTLAYSQSADEVLRPLSEATGGFYAFFDESLTSTVLQAIATLLLRDVSVCEEDDKVEIERQPVQLTPDKDTFEHTVLIDSTVGNNTIFAFTLSLNDKTKITITDPRGNVYGSSSSYYSVDKTLNVVRFTIPMAQVGRWKYTLARGSDNVENIIALVTSNPKYGVNPIEVESWLSSKAFNYSQGSGVVAYAYVHKGYESLLKAKVELTITSFGEEPIKTVLRDDGKMPDNRAMDGVYSEYVLGFKANARYSNEVRAESVAGETVIIKGGNDLRGKSLPVFQNVSAPVTFEPVEDFNRVTYSGAIDIIDLDTSIDQLDPSRVTDLDLLIHRRNDMSVSLKWTAPGDDLTYGTVSKYVIRISTTFSNIKTNFENSYEVKSSDILSGSIQPLQAGSQQRVELKVPETWNTDFYVIGLKAFDEANRSSELSNLKSITFKPISVPQRTTTPPPRTVYSPTSSRTTPSGDGFWKPSPKWTVNGSIIGIGLASGLALMIFIILIFFVVCVFRARQGYKGMA